MKLPTVVGIILKNIERFVCISCFGQVSIVIISTIIYRSQRNEDIKDFMKSIEKSR